MGWLEVKIGDIDGGQWIGRVEAEYLLGRRWAVGGALNVSRVFVDWAGVETKAGESVLTAVIDMDINDFSIYGRVRF